jgi:hypothetical protein
MCFMKGGRKLKTKMFLFAVFTILFFVSGCSNSEVKSIENAKEIQFIVAFDGVVVNSGDVQAEEEINKIVDWHNNATFISEEKENLSEETFPLAEKFSNSNIGIYIDPDWIVRMTYKKNNIFKVIHELQGKQRAYYIKAPELLEFIKENKNDD